MRILAGATLAATVPIAGRRIGIPFLAAVESVPLLEEIRRLLAALLGEVEVEMVPQEGPVALNRLRGARSRLVFLPMDLRLMEGLTLLRALPPARARQVVLLVPDTVEGYRVAWEALCLGARDFMVTRGAPPQRLKGGTGARLRQLAHLISADDEFPTAEPLTRPHTSLRPALSLATGAEEPIRCGPSGTEGAAPWLLLPESRHLAGLASWLRSLPLSAPAVVRVPEGIRFLRVVREGLGRLVRRPVRELSNGDRLVPGHVHLWTDLEVLQVCGEESFVRARLSPLAGAPGSWGARREMLTALLTSPVSLRLALPDADLAEEEDLLAGAGRHSVFRLEPGPGSAGSVREPAEVWGGGTPLARSMALRSEGTAVSLEGAALPSQDTASSGEEPSRREAA
jgi:chemotaxis response regulator CheB